MAKLITTLFLLTVWVSQAVTSPFLVPGLPRTSYKKLGHVNIGGIFRVHEYDPNSPCASTVRGPKSYQYHEGMVHSIDLINADKTILHNITLGYVILDDCTKDQTALARAMNFIPPMTTCDCVNGTNATGGHHDVIGVVSGSNSQNTMTAAGFLSMFSIPVIGAVSTSDLLSDKVKYPYFLRVVPPDRYQAQAMIDIIKLYNWTYISLIYSDGSYGEMGAKSIQKLAESSGICIAYTREVDKSRGHVEYAEIVHHLYQFRGARVVVLFVQGSDARGVMQAAKDANRSGHFIWIASDGVSPSSDLVGLGDVAAGGLFVQLYSTGTPTFRSYFEGLTPHTSDNPWLPELFNEEFGCSFADDTCRNNSRVSTMPNYRPYNKTGLFHDVIKTYALGLHQLINENCPEAFVDPASLSHCVSGKTLYGYLKNVSFMGSYGLVRFDSNGNADGKYEISQLQVRITSNTASYDVVTIGLWDKITGSLDLSDDVLWTGVNKLQANQDMSIPHTDLPKSLCSYPCGPGEFLIQHELKCCWECRRCRENEIVVANGTSCKECPTYMWPAELTFLSCKPIEPSSLGLMDTVSILFVAFTLTGLIVSSGVMAVFIKHRRNKLIKATSMSLSSITLAGLMLGYLAAIVTMVTPNDPACYISRFGFNLSFAMAYAPLLAKTSRIYRIFASGKKGSKKVPFISSRSQVMFSTVLILIQVPLSACVTVLFPPRAKLVMPVSTERYVELLCDLPLQSLIPPLTYNLVLILCCIFYAFKARSLPDNFNDSRYIFVCVSATLFLWLAFLPTYFAAFYAYHKVMLLALLLILSSTIMLLCLYVPRVYAVLYVDEVKLKIKSTTLTIASEGTSVNAAHGPMENNT